jgi:hypothetical protein
VVQTRTYGPDLYAEMGYTERDGLEGKLARNIDLLRGEEDFEGFD